MPKAILELPKMPESCWQCELYSTAHNCCNVCKHIGNRNGKHFECPNCGNINAPWMPYCNCQITQYKTETQEQATEEVVDQEPITQVRGFIYMLNTHKSMIVYPCATAYLLIEPQIKMKNGQDMLILYGNE